MCRRWPGLWGVPTFPLLKTKPKPIPAPFTRTGPRSLHSPSLGDSLTPTLTFTGLGKRAGAQEGVKALAGDAGSGLGPEMKRSGDQWGLQSEAKGFRMSEGAVDRGRGLRCRRR